MTAPAAAPGLRPLLAAVRVHRALVSALVLLAVLGWWWTVQEMRGMDDGPWTGLGGLAWFLAVWVVMMAAMMFPSVAPTVALYARMTAGTRRAVLFTTGYLATWAGAGVVAYAVGLAADRVAGGWLAWDAAGRPLAAATLLVAAGYELTPLKNVCLGKCRSPLGALLGSWRDGGVGALTMGAKNGGWCVGCCWALMAGLFALGIMSVTWMAVVAVLIAVEKLLPWRRGATVGTALVLALLGVLVLVAPESLPGLTVPGTGPTMGPMGT